MELFNDARLPVPSHVTLAAGTVHNPDDIRHFMKIKPVTAQVTIEHAGEVLAQTQAALRVLEVGHDLYDPALYIPRDDVSGPIALVRGMTTYCPIKGDAVYYRRPEDSDDAPPLGWAYPDPIAIAEALAGHIAFDADVVTVTITPVSG